MAKEMRRFNPGAILVWVLLVCAGWAVSWGPGPAGNSMLVDLDITSGVWDVTYPMIATLSGLIGGAISGLLLGLGQRRAIRRVLPEVTAWLAPTVLGMALGWGIA